MANIVFWRFIFANGDVFADRSSFGFDAVIKLVVLGFVMARAPVM